MQVRDVIARDAKAKSRLSGWLGADALTFPRLPFAERNMCVLPLLVLQRFYRY